MGSPHCIGMCGGILGALSHSTGITNSERDNNSPNFNLYPLAFNMGRVFSYCLIGFILGSVSSLSQPLLGDSGIYIARTLTGMAMILVAIQLGRWWPGVSKIEWAGQKIWRGISQWIKPLLPIDNIVKALVAGSLWGWIPCGMVYSVLIMAAASGSNVNASLIMLGFGLGTVPILSLFSIASTTLTQKFNTNKFRIPAAAFILFLGAWTIAGAWLNPDHMMHH